MFPAIFGVAAKAILPTIGKAILGTVAPKLLDIAKPGLKSLTDGFVDKGADFLKGLAGNLRLPGPLGALGLDKLIGKGIDALADLLKGLKDNGIDSLADRIQQAVQQPSERTTSDGVSVTPPALMDRLDELLKLLTSLTDNANAAGNTAGSTASTASTAATTAAAPLASTTAAAPATGTSSTAAAGANNPMSMLTGLKMPSMDQLQADLNAAGDDQVARQMALMKFQQAQNQVQEMMQMVSNIMKKQNDINMAIIGNYR